MTPTHLPGGEEASMDEVDIRLWCIAIIEGPGGMDAYERTNWADLLVPDRVGAAMWTIRCLANVDNLQSGRVLEAIMAERERRKGEAKE